MSFWDRYRTPPTEPEPVPAAEAADFGRLMLRQRDQALADRDAHYDELMAAKAKIKRLEADNELLRSKTSDDVTLAWKRQAEQDRANAVRLERDNRVLWLVNEDIQTDLFAARKELSALRALVNGEPVAS